MATISVVIPCFNLGDLLTEAVESVRRQTKACDELIIVDDGSHDTRTIEVLDQLEQLGERVLHTPNRGASAARNFGIANSQGQYILCFDGDDILHPMFLEETASVLDAHADVGMVSSHVEYFGTMEGLWRTGDFAPVTLLWRNCICGGSLYRRLCWEQAGGYKTLPGCQDWEFWISVTEQGWKWDVVPKPLYRYRRRNGSISEHRDANRPAILRQIIAWHRATYDKHLPEVLIELDTELQLLRAKVARYEAEKRSPCSLPKPPQPEPALIAPPPELEPTEHFSFSVVICTYKREKYLGKAIESLFAQNYPKDKYEIIVIDNASPDETAEVARHYQAISPVPFSYYVEHRNGLSFARNLGIEKSRYEYVAHLDDDATASQDWLASFNRVINQHRAMVVGGRVDKVFEPGFTPPSWFETPYIRGFFGINYRERGRSQRVFRIRYPLYIGGGNSAYARRLFPAFGGYDTQLGRNGKTLLAGEESYLNMVMDQHDIPIYYTDDAVIHHFIESDRITKKHLVRKAYWAGVSSAIMYAMFFGCRDTMRRTPKNWKEIGALLRKIVSSRRDSENFSRWCRVVFNISFLWKFYRVYFASLIGRKVYKPPPVSWNDENWIDEFSRWPDGEPKFRQLFEMHLARGDTTQAEQALSQLERYLAEHGSSGQPASLESLHGPLRRRKYEQLVEAVHRMITQHIPEHARVLVVSRGDEQLVGMPGWKLSHFPQDAQGGYAGFYPANSDEAIRHLNGLRKKGMEYLVFPAPALWWLEHYRELREYLIDHGRIVAQDNEYGWIFALRPLFAPDAGSDHSDVHQWNLVVAG